MHLWHDDSILAARGSLGNEFTIRLTDYPLFIGLAERRFLRAREREIPRNGHGGPEWNSIFWFLPALLGESAAENGLNPCATSIDFQQS